MREQSPPLYEPLADDLLGAMTEAVYAVDCDRRIIFWNAAAEQLTAYSAAEVVGRRCQDNLLNHVDETGRQLCGDGCPLLATVQDGRTREALVSLHHRSGHCLPVAVRAAALRSADETIIGAVEVFHDDSRFRAVNDLLDTARREALTDPLTGIANRRMLHRALDLRHDEYRRYGRSYAVLFGDVDHFKRFNEHYGHNVGDQVLRLIATTLSGSSRPSDTAGRWGGDEFLLVAPVNDQEQALALADRARRLLAGSSPVPQRGDVSVTLTVGVAVVRPGEEPKGLVQRASAATLRAKRAGPNSCLGG
jgi:diguanylate cyclase (GGDEF)-like protein/PAS domain S-box-containing protein